MLSIKRYGFSYKCDGQFVQCYQENDMVSPTSVRDNLLNLQWFVKLLSCRM